MGNKRNLGSGSNPSRRSEKNWQIDRKERGRDGLQGTDRELILKLRAPVKTDLWSIFDLRGALGYIAV